LRWNHAHEDPEDPEEETDEFDNLKRKKEITINVDYSPSILI
jgi:hypothetical protein